MKPWRTLQRLILAILSIALLGAATVGWWLHRPLALASPAVELSIEAGTPPREVAAAWVRAGVLTEPAWLYHWFRFSGQDRQDQALQRAPGFHRIASRPARGPIRDRGLPGQPGRAMRRLGNQGVRESGSQGVRESGPRGP